MPYDPRRSQFAQGLPFAMAVDLCGPALALAFVTANGGRTPTLAEARDLAAAGSLWKQGVGMLGPDAEVALMRKMGVDAAYTPGVDWGGVAARTQRGELVGLSTPNHYWQISGYDPETRKYFVGTSGTDMRRGAAWMTADQIADVGGGLHGIITTGKAAAQAPATVPRARQQELEANAPGESGPVTSTAALQAGTEPPHRRDTTPDVPDAPEQPGQVVDPATAALTKPQETEEQKRQRQLLYGLQQSDAYSKHLMGQLPESAPLASPYTLPGLAPIDPGWRKFALPGGY